MVSIVCPDYLCHNTLPYASDIFYHRKIVYTLPTGFHSEETNAVINFPEYCKKNSIFLNDIVWVI